MVYIPWYEWNCDDKIAAVFLEVNIGVEPGSISSIEETQTNKW